MLPGCRTHACSIAVSTGQFSLKDNYQLSIINYHQSSTSCLSWPRRIPIIVDLVAQNKEILRLCVLPVSLYFKGPELLTWLIICLSWNKTQQPSPIKQVCGCKSATTGESGSILKANWLQRLTVTKRLYW